MADEVEGTITLNDILKSIDVKCDKTECEAIKALLSASGLEKQGNKVNTILEVLDDEIELKYPSVKLLKDELKLVWNCMGNRMKFHGDYNDNTTKGRMLDSSGNCVLGGSDDVDVRIGVDIGDTVTKGTEVRRDPITGDVNGVKGTDGSSIPVVWSSLVNDNVSDPEEKGNETWIPMNYLKYAVCSNMSMWKFHSCEELENVSKMGIGNCPLKEGQIAIVAPPNSECFDIYRYTEVPSGFVDPDGDECGIIVGTNGSTVQKWTSYAECHKSPPAVVSNDVYAVNLVDTGSSYSLLMSDGSAYTVPYPKGKSTTVGYLGNEYASQQDGDFQHVMMGNIISEANGGCVDVGGGNAVVRTSGVYSVSLQMTHHNDNLSRIGARMTNVFGSDSPAHPVGVSSFFSLSAYNNDSNLFAQSVLNWTGLLNAGDPIVTFMDAGASSVAVDENKLKVWVDPKYTAITITKVGE